MVVKNLILPPRHASHRGPALPAIHSFSHLRVSRPLTRRLDRPPLSSPTILQPSVREREREREERREKRRVVVVVGRKGGLRTQARSRVWPAPSGLGVFKAGQARNGGNARPTEPSGQRAASHRAHQPTRCAATGNNLAFPFARGFCAGATRRASLSPAANAPRPTEPSGQRTPPHRACRPTRRAPPSLPPNAPRGNREQPCFPLCQGLLYRCNAMFQTRSQGRTLHTATTVFTTEKCAVSRGTSRVVVGLVGVVAGPARSLHSFSAAQPVRLALHTV